MNKIFILFLIQSVLSSDKSDGIKKVAFSDGTVHFTLSFEEYEKLRKLPVNIQSILLGHV